jgi:hypothetical protein
VQEIENCLSEYPLLDDEYYYKLEYDAMIDLWNNVYSYQDKKAFCIKYGISINQARHKFETTSTETLDYFRMYECTDL